jgi:hypothetical protein
MNPLLFSFAIAPVVKLLSEPFERKRQGRETKAREDLAKLQREANLAQQQGQFEHAKELFEMARHKELEFQRIQFENQRALARETSALALDREDAVAAQKGFPLHLTPTQVLQSPDALLVVTRYGVIPSIDGPPTDGSKYMARVRDLDTQLSLFLQDGYRSDSNTHGTLLLEGAWRSHSLSGQSAVIALHSFLKSRATLFLEQQIVRGQILVNVSHWGPGAEKFSFFTFSRFPFDPSDDERFRRRVEALFSLASGTAADMRYLFNDGAEALLLPGKLPELISDEEDEVIAEGVSKVLDSYRSAFENLAETTPHRAAEHALDVARQLTKLRDKSHARCFLTLSLKIFLKSRGSASIEGTSISELLNAVTLIQFDHDAAYFNEAKALRRVLLGDELDAESTVSLKSLPAATDLTFEQKLDDARESVAGITSAVEALCARSPEDLEGYEAGELIQTLRLSTEGLKAPTFRMVPVGVTSSGKSTLIGAVIGRALVPRGIEELSVGVLRFIHRPDGLKLRQAWPSPNGGQERIEEQEFEGEMGTRDAELAEALKRIMTGYRENGYEQGEPFPRIEIETSMLPGNWREMFALPPGVGFEFVDVPGLNSTDNRDKNLATIQAAIRGSFCVFIFDWYDTGKDRAARLLSTIKEMLNDTNADPESVVFVLNKFDGRDLADSPEDIARRIESFSQMLQSSLKLDAKPDIVTMSTRLWFNAQVAWGPNEPDSKPSIPAPVRQNWFKALRTDDTGTVMKMNAARRAWFVNTFQIMDETPALDLSEDDFRRLMREIIYPESGAEEFCRRVADRVRRRCISLVIKPIVLDSLRKTEAFLTAVRKRYKDAQLEKADEITDEIERIRRCTATLNRLINEEAKSFEMLSIQTLKLAATRKGEKEEEFYQEWAKRGIDLPIFFETMTALRKDLAENLAKPLRAYTIGQNAPLPWLAVLSKERAHKLHECANEYFKRLLIYKKRGSDRLSLECAVLSSLSEDSEQKKQVARAEQAYKTLLGQLRLALSERCNYILQRRLGDIAAQSQKLLDHFYERIKQLVTETVSNSDLIEIMLAGRQPPPVIELIENQSFEAESAAQKKKEVKTVAEEEVAKIRTAVKKTGDAFKFLWRKARGAGTEDLFQEVKKTVYYEREYEVSVLPSDEGIEEQVNKVFDKHADNLQERLLQWFSGLLTEYAASLTEAAEKVSATLSEGLREQLRKSSGERQHEIEQWKELAGELGNGLNWFRVLQISMSERPTPVNDA